MTTQQLANAPETAFLRDALTNEPCWILDGGDAGRFLANPYVGFSTAQRTVQAFLLSLGIGDDAVRAVNVDRLPDDEFLDLLPDLATPYAELIPGDDGAEVSRVTISDGPGGFERPVLFESEYGEPVVPFRLPEPGPDGIPFVAIGDRFYRAFIALGASRWLATASTEFVRVEGLVQTDENDEPFARLLGFVAPVKLSA